MWAGLRLSQGFIPGAEAALGFSPSRRAQHSLELLLGLPCCGFPAPARGSFPAHPSPEESEQHLLVRSAGSTCGMPLITVLIGFLLVPSLFSEQKAGGCRCCLLFHNKSCSCGDQRCRNCGAFFSFLFVP